MKLNIWKFFQILPTLSTVLMSEHHKYRFLRLTGFFKWKTAEIQIFYEKLPKYGFPTVFVWKFVPIFTKVPNFQILCGFSGKNVFF